MNYVRISASAAQHDRRWLLTTLLVVLGAAFVAPLGMIVIGAAAPVRILFPVYTFAIALWLQTSRRPILPSFIIALFAFSPFLRRLSDYDAGFDMFSPVLLGPYFALLPTLPSFVRRALGQTGGPNSSFLILAICITYAALVALLQSRLLAGSNELIRWLLPISLCTFVMERPDDVAAIKRSLVATLVCVLPLLTIYGLKQYVDPQPWDVAWMQATRTAQIAGLPYPYQVRVYSMMNSAMSLAIFVTSGFALLAGEGGVGLVIGATALPVLALTLDRQAWLQCAIASVLLAMQAPPGRRITLVLGVILISLGALGILAGGFLPSAAQNHLDQRLATFSSLSTDTSADDRLRTYGSFYDRLADSPMGEGFGVNSSTASDAEKRDLPSLDSSLLEVGLTFGVVMGPLFGTTIAALAWMAFKARKLEPDRLVGGSALVISILLTSPLGSNLTGESGIITWTALGILLSAPSRGWLRTFTVRAPFGIRRTARFANPAPQPLAGRTNGNALVVRTGM